MDANGPSNPESNSLQLDNLMISLQRFFDNNQNMSGIFTFNRHSFAIMRNSDSYFVMNSYATSGIPTDPDDRDGTACLAKMFTIPSVANYLFVACNRGNDLPEDFPIIFYLITTIDIKNKIFGSDKSARQRVTRDLSPTENMKIELVGSENVACGTAMRFSRKDIVMSSEASALKKQR